MNNSTESCITRLCSECLTGNCWACVDRPEALERSGWKRWGCSCPCSPVLLDLFCGVGGAAMGYFQAGFTVVGVDIEPQLHYPFEFHQADALDFSLEGFDAIHASPPCPRHSTLTGWGRSRRVAPERADLIPAVRERLVASGVPYVIENVRGAPLHNAVQVCGQSLGLRVRRHRLFESNVPIMVPPCHHPEPPVIVVRGSIGRKVFDPRRRAIAPTLEQAREVMEMPWAVTAAELSDAIPPAYTRLIGGDLRTELRMRQEVAA